MLALNHKELDVWKLSLSFVSLIYELTNSFPVSEQYGITNQLRRAAVSIPSNIAEGASRNSVKDRKRFYEIARSSLVEINTQLEIARILNYLVDQERQKMIKIEENINRIFAMLTKLKDKTV
jgi:four helix bundle protein